MGIEKITLMRDKLYDSAQASKLLKSKKVSKLLNENNIEFIEVYSDSNRCPMLVVSGEAYSYKGYDEIVRYVNSLNQSKKDK